jgi:hypothetical protein
MRLLSFPRLSLHFRVSVGLVIVLDGGFARGMMDSAPAGLADLVLEKPTKKVQFV